MLNKYGKSVLTALAVTICFACHIDQEVRGADKVPTALNHTAKDIDGQDVKLEKYEGRVLLVVNLASRWGRTKQYLQLQALHAKYNSKGLSILGFPCNQFGLQEPGTNAEIKEFCSAKYSVAFDLFSKVNVNGDQAHGFYKHLTAQNTSPKAAGKVSWNFEKFLIDRSGTVIARFDGKVKPDSAELVKLIEQHLAK